MPKTPSYRLRPGYTPAIVTLNDSATGKRRDYWLGEFDSPASRECYHRLIAEWEAAGRRLPESIPGARAGYEDRALTVGPSVARVLLTYWRWARKNHGKKRASNIKVTLRVVIRYFGTTPAADFGPKKLRVVREEMIRGDAREDYFRKPWSRKTINERIGTSSTSSRSGAGPIADESIGCSAVPG